MLTETYGGKTYSYDYDEAGNIRSVSDGTTTHSYSYSDAQWKDLLTAYDGQSISYDAIGNPTAWYDGTAFTWELGRRLTSAVNSGTGLDNSYTYVSNGLRLTKTIGDIEHKYVWQGSRLVSENWAGQELEFFYDESGSPYAFSYKSSATATPVMYYYVTNLQGDVVNILNASGSTVASYSYNAWGKVLTATGTMAAVNPLRYRGYYYDTDTGLYYLQSRYYDPQICRFINADEAFDLGTGILFGNLFSYCANNPVNLLDQSGNFVVSMTIVCAAVGMIIGATAGGFAGNAIAKKLGVSDQEQKKYIFTGIFVGGVTGMFGGWYVAPTIASAVGLSGFSVTASAGVVGLPIFSGGQLHHVISNKILSAINAHPTLAGTIDRTSSTIQAYTQQAHRGYQAWHREIDSLTVKWLNCHPEATSKELGQFLYSLYSRPDMIRRFGEDVLKYLRINFKL